MSGAILFLLFLLTPLATPISVLILHPIYGGSHVLTLNSLANTLLEQGHKVTTIRYQDSHKLTLPHHQNHTQLMRSLDNSEGKLPYLSHEEKATFDLPQDILWGKGLNVFTILTALDAWKVMDHFCENLLGDVELFGELTAAQYDIAVVDLVYNECGLAVAHKLNIPTVGYWAFSFSNMQQDFTTAPAPPSYIPGFMTKLTDQMNFSERSYNFMIKIFSRMMMNYHDWYMSSLISKYLDDKPSSSQLLNNLSGVLINTDYVIDYPRPMPPTFINIGGLQINEKKHKLPAHIQKFMDEAPYGCLLFTMGFIFNPRVVPQERLETILEAFSLIPHRVIFKFDKVNHTNLTIPENVLILDWVPQQAVLAHPNCQVFVTHCGMHGVLESIHHGVPMVGMPVFIDQGDIMPRIEQRKIGVGIDKFAGKDEIVAAVTEVSENPIYRTNVRKLSTVLRARKNHPMDDALWLLNYVISTEGADHMKIKSGKLSLIQFYCLDCILVWLLSALLLVTIPYQILRTRNKPLPHTNRNVELNNNVK